MRLRVAAAIEPEIYRGDVTAAVAERWELCDRSDREFNRSVAVGLKVVDRGAEVVVAVDGDADLQVKGQPGMLHVGVAGDGQIAVGLLDGGVDEDAVGVVDAGEDLGGELVVAVGSRGDADVVGVGGNIDGVAAEWPFDFDLGNRVGVEDVAGNNRVFRFVAGGQDLELEQDFGRVGCAAHHGPGERVGPGGVGSGLGALSAGYWGQFNVDLAGMGLAGGSSAK